MAKDYTKEQVIEAIKKSNGFITKVAKQLAQIDGKCSWTTAEKFIKRWSETQEAYRGAREEFVDLAEETMRIGMKKNKDQHTAKFVAQTLGRNRGYHTELHIKSTTDFSNLPDEIKDWTIGDFIKVTFGGNAQTDLEDEVFDDREEGEEF